MDSRTDESKYSTLSEQLQQYGIAHMCSKVSESIADEILLEKLRKNDYLEIGVVTEGSGVHCIKEKIIPCKVGDMYIVPPGVPHGYFITEPGATLTIQILAFYEKTWFSGDVILPESERYCYGLFQDGASVAYAMLNMDMRGRVTSLMNRIARELKEQEDEWKSIVNAQLTELCASVSRYINRSNIQTHKRSKDWKLTTEMMRIIEEEYGDYQLSLDSISSRLFVSSSILSRIFKAQSGRLFSEYLRDVRMNCAARLLSESDETVEHIILQCGFRDTSSFYRNFRKTFGVTPQAYKELTKPSTPQNKERKDIKMEIFREISINVQNGKAKIVKELVAQAIEVGASPAEILNEGLLAGMNVIGEKFKNNEVYVPEVLVAARAMSMGTQILKPYLTESGVSATGKVCIGTVQGDLHDIGKNLVKMMMEGKGLEVIDLGTDVSPETFVQTAIDEDCQIICCSALLTTTMSVMGEVVKAAKAAGIREKVKIMVGGAPINQEFCDAIGADCYTVDAASAAEAAVAFCQA